MKVLIVNFSDHHGGAARASFRLHMALRSIGVNSNMLVQDKTLEDLNVLGPESIFERTVAKIQAIVNYAPSWFNKSINKRYFSYSFSPSFNVVRKINELNPDIVHLHWINAGMLRIEDLDKIKAPIVWSLHDSWPFTGGCHIMWDCEKFKSYCGSCHILNSSQERDKSFNIWNRKKYIFQDIDITIVGLSRWIANNAKESSLFRDKNIINLPNPISIDEFKLIDRNESRMFWKLPKNKKLILFGALFISTDVNKGYSKLIEALFLIGKGQIEFVVFGMNEPEIIPNLNHKIHFLGQINDNMKLAKLYNAADVLVVPSLQENLSNTIMESLSCGTPVVAFDIGGNGDLIEHKKNGYLAANLDPGELSKGIEWVLNSSEHENLRMNARKKVLTHFESKMVGEKYKNLYESILQ